MYKGSPFLNILPSLDLHGYTREMIYVPVDEFINDNLKLNHKKILIVHGKGEGVLKQELHLCVIFLILNQLLLMVQFVELKKLILIILSQIKL